MNKLIEMIKKLLAAPVEPVKEKEQEKLLDPSIVIQARSKAKEIIIEAKDEALKIKTQAEKDASNVRGEVTGLEKDLAVKKAQVEVKSKELEERADSLRKAKVLIEQKQEDVANLYKEQKDNLERVASMTKQEAREELLKKVDKDLAEEKAKRIREMQDDVKKNVEKEAKELLISAMRHGATDYVVEYTTSKVKLPDDEIKGRIIGKEGRNIKRFEELTGVELDLDSSPGDAIISCLDPIRREIARVSLERLIKDGRIQPGRIEDIIEQTGKEVDQIMYKAGEDLCHKVGVYNIHTDLIRMLGKFKYRFSYGQNMIEHTLEETKMGIAIAHELKVDVDVVRLGCLFHDIGKVVDDTEGSHVQLGVDLLTKYGVDDRVINCVAEHHEDRPFSSIESALVNLVDHVSGARPGARGEDYESYVKRMSALEDAAKGFDGVDRVYAISAGREVRVFVKPDAVDDASTEFLAKEIARKIELEQTYPGVVKVTVIRETRVSETAK